MNNNNLTLTNFSNLNCLATLTRLNKISKMITINVILSFKEYEQQFFDIQIKNKNITKEKFLSIIFDILNGYEIRDLMKISTCQYAKPEDCIKWLWEENGKLYFNIDVNKDDDTQENYDLKKKYCKEEEGKYYKDF